MNNLYDNLANLLVNVTKDVVFDDVKDWVYKKNPNLLFISRVGTGKKTYHRKLNSNTHLIIYGKKMIADKMHSIKRSSLWLTGKEIINRNYFDGKITPQNVLVAVVLHEFAHFIQVLNNEREYKSVHNEYFYKVLDRMHNSEIKNKVFDYLNKYEIFKNLSFINNDEDNIEFNKYKKSEINENDIIFFKNSKNQIVNDIVLKINKDTVNCVLHKVPISLIQRKETDINYLDEHIRDRIPKFNKKNVKIGDYFYFMNGNKVIKDEVIKVNPTRVVGKKYSVPYFLIYELQRG